MGHIVSTQLSRETDLANVFFGLASLLTSDAIINTFSLHSHACPLGAQNVDCNDQLTSQVSEYPKEGYDMPEDALRIIISSWPSRSDNTIMLQGSDL